MPRSTILGTSVRTAMPRRAARTEPAIKNANVKQLKRIEGQVRGLLRMVQEERYCADILTQIAAVRESLRTVAQRALNNHLRHCARKALHAGDAQADAMTEELVKLFGRLGA